MYQVSRKVEQLWGIRYIEVLYVSGDREDVSGCRRLKSAFKSVGTGRVLQVLLGMIEYPTSQGTSRILQVVHGKRASLAIGDREDASGC